MFIWIVVGDLWFGARNFNDSAWGTFWANENFCNCVLDYPEILWERPVSFFQSLKINYIPHPYFTWLSWLAMRWKTSSFSSIFIHAWWGLITEFPIFKSLYHLFCGFKNTQKQPCACVLQKWCSSKCCKIYKKNPTCTGVY